MNIKLTTILVLSLGYLALPAMAQKGFTTKAEAKNEMAKGQKKGNWLEYLDKTGKVTADTSAPYYTLAVYKKGLKNGVCNSYLKGGKLQSSIPYKDDKISGVAKYYYEDGKLAGETNFTDNHLNGSQKTYYESGKVKSENTWLNDKMTASKSYDENGNVTK
jgi:antitoxin component YwqK of YwqJK toxin-antitoxin module